MNLILCSDSPFCNVIGSCPPGFFAVTTSDWAEALDRYPTVRRLRLTATSLLHYRLYPAVFPLWALGRIASALRM
ncbi:MAG: hypothetical protein QME96_03305 [Myxococcota bacterium]|nr:hypothetical protein [Myxococcota bacterium]